MEWRDIKGYEGYYQVSNTGLVKAVNRVVTFTDERKRLYKEKMLPLKEWFKNGHGYLMVTLTKHHKSKGFSIHRLVAEAFIPNPNNLPQVNHKDEDKTNNNVSNLEWCDAKYNNRYSNLTAVTQYNREGKAIKEWDSIIDASKALNIPTSNIIMCCQRKTKSCKGYFWRYSKDGPPNSLEDFTVSEAAKEERKKHYKRYAKENRIKLNAAALAFYHKNKDTLNKKRKEQYYENIEKKREYAREYYKTHYKKIKS